MLCKNTTTSIKNNKNILFLTFFLQKTLQAQINTTKFA